MQGKIFTVKFDNENGGIKELYLNDDAFKMNWIKPGRGFGVPTFVHNIKYHGEDTDFKLCYFEEGEDTVKACYKTYGVQTEKEESKNAELYAESIYSFDENGNLCVKTTVKNVSRWQKFFLEGDLGVSFNLYDDYCDANTCMTSRCSAHIWCGNDSSWVCALKMGNSGQNLGIVFTEGGASSYSQEGAKHSDRGYFTLNLDVYTLLPGEEYTYSYVVFEHSGKTEFLQKLTDFPHCAVITSDNFTYFKGEKISLAVECAAEDIKLLTDIEVLSKEKNGNKTVFTLNADVLGEHKITVKYGKNGELETYAKVFVSEDIETVISRRLNFIVDKQQYLSEGNTLDGAFLVYDTETGRLHYDESWSDHNAQRERLGMSIMLARYLQTHKDARLEASLKKSMAFVYRNVFDKESGEVFNFAGKYSTWLRLYNFPWVALLLTEVYRAFGGKEKLYDAYTIMNAYYERGGRKFYPNGIFVYDIISEFRGAGMEKEAECLKKSFLEHVEQIIERGTKYPKHEVNYEQTIVTPAVAFITDAYRLTGDKRYLEAVKEHIAVLERFDGIQPHYMLNNIAIRFCDDYWFGKLHTYGDTLHYWSSLSSVNYIKYAFQTVGTAESDEKLKNGVCGLRNCLCLFMTDGSASCARLIPFEVNGVKGERYDPFANDQDFALYFAYKFLPK